MNYLTKGSYYLISIPEIIGGCRFTNIQAMCNTSSIVKKKYSGMNCKNYSFYVNKYNTFATLYVRAVSSLLNSLLFPRMVT